MTPAIPRRSALLSRVLIGAPILLVAVAGLFYLGIRHLLWPHPELWQPRLLSHVERLLERPVRVDRLVTSWEGLHPGLQVDGLQVLGLDGEPRLHVARAYARLSWRSLLTGRPRLAVLRLDRPQLTVERQVSGVLTVAGIEVMTPESQIDPKELLAWLLGQGDVRVDDGSIRWIDWQQDARAVDVAGVQVRVRNQARHHQLSVALGAPGALAESAAAAADFLRPPLTFAADWRRWKGELHLAGNRVDLAAVGSVLRGLAPGVAWAQAMSGASGELDQMAWLRFDGGQALDGVLKVHARSAVLPLELGPLALRDARGEARAERQADGGFALIVTDLSVVEPGGVAVRADGPVRLGLDAQGRPRSASLRVRPLETGAALALLRALPLPSEPARRLRALETSGTVTDLDLQWLREPDAGNRFDVSARLDRLSLRMRTASGAAPGFTNLSGTVRATEQAGTLSLQGPQSSLTFPGVFAEPTVPFEQLDVDASWSVDRSRGERWLQVQVPRLAFANADAAGSASGQYGTGGKGPGVLDLTGSLSRANGARVARYLPLPISESVRDWVTASIRTGAARDVRFRVRGDLRDFPFRDPAAGEFRVAAQLTDTLLAFSPQWPAIAKVRGTLVFERAGMDIQAESAQVYGVRLAGTHARIADFAQPDLLIDGTGTGPAQDLLRFLDESPLVNSVEGFTRDARIDGDAQLALKLELPLHDLAATRAAGSVTFAGNRIDLDRTLPAFSDVAGRLEFTERTLALRGMRATLLGGPLSVEAQTTGEGLMRIDAHGTIDAQGMRQITDNPLTRRLEGRTDYRASVDVNRRASTLRLESDLVGLSSSLPAPFAKQAHERWPLRVTSTPTPPARADERPAADRIDVRLRENIALAFERTRDPGSQRLLIGRAGFAVDAEPVLRDSGLSVLLHGGAIDFDAWRRVLSDTELSRLEATARTGVARGFSLAPDFVSVVAPDVRIGGRDLHDVVFGASRSEGFWRANISADEINGYFYWLDAAPGQQIGTLTARFTRLVLPRSREGELESALSASPDLLPALDVTAEDFVLGDHSLGSLSVRATNGGTPARPVWSLDRLVIANPAARFEATGSWAFAAGATVARTASLGPAPVVDPAARRTELDFTLSVRNAGELLERFGQKNVLRGGAGSLTGDLHWQGSPLALDYGSLQGAMAISLGRGQFLKVDPGVAKLIGVLNLQSLPKRLSLDFRDLFSEGFAFDEITGDLRVVDGVARTTALNMKGLQAQVSIRGEADLRHETQKLHVAVLPEVNAGLASIAYGAMVNPLIGLGSFAAQYVLRRPLQEAFGYEVDVTGSWTDPAVSERIRRARGVAPSLTP